MKKDYTEFDAALLAHITAGSNKMLVLEGKADLQKLSVPLREIDRWGSPTPHFRIIDRRLQALRRAEKIRFNGKFWIMPLPAAPQPSTAPAGSERKGGE